MFRSPKLWFTLLIWAALVGCTQAFPTAQMSEPPTQSPSNPLTELLEQSTEALPEESEETSEPTQPTAAPTATDLPVVEPTQLADPTGVIPTEAPAETTPLGDPELHATNPSTVNLASGKVQLVEFFAFW